MCMSSWRGIRREIVSAKPKIMKPTSDGKEKGEKGNAHPRGGECIIDLTHGESLRLDAFLDFVGHAYGACHVCGVTLGQLA